MRLAQRPSAVQDCGNLCHSPESTRPQRSASVVPDDQYCTLFLHLQFMVG